MTQLQALELAETALRCQLLQGDPDHPLARQGQDAAAIIKQMAMVIRGRNIEARFNRATKVPKTLRKTATRPTRGTAQ